MAHIIMFPVVHRKASGRGSYDGGRIAGLFVAFGLCALLWFAIVEAAMWIWRLL